MRSFAVVPLLAAAVNALPQAASSCVTVTTELIIPTSTYTFLSTYVTTTTASTAEDLGTFTLVEDQSSTKTLETLTSTSTVCTASGTITAAPTTTVYTTAGAATSSAPIPRNYKRVLGLNPRQDDGEPCTTTEYTFTTTYGVTETYIPANKTSTYTDYTDFSLATVTSTSSGFTAYAIATATATTSAVCGPTVNATSPTTVTTTQDARCAPSALTSAYDGFGLEYAEDTTIGGAAFTTSTDDASQCCQLCADTPECASSYWDIRSNVCKLDFPIDYQSGDLNCGLGALVFYDAGPDHPMAPGTGLFVAQLCGTVDYANAPPDDGS